MGTTDDAQEPARGEESEKKGGPNVHFSAVMVFLFVTAAIVMAFRDCMA